MRREKGEQQLLYIVSRKQMIGGIGYSICGYYWRMDLLPLAILYVHGSG